MLYVITALFILFDLLTGIVKALKNNAFDSSVMRQGLFHKCGSIFCIAFGVLVDYAQGFLELGVNVPVAVAICSYISLMEISSIIENIGEINPEIVPEKLMQFFTKLNKGSDKKNDEKNDGES